MTNIKELIEEFCVGENLDYRENYSGRCVFGTTCIGIVCSNPLLTLQELFAYIVDSDDELRGYEVQHALGEPKLDNMGLNYILYFPELVTE